MIILAILAVLGAFAWTAVVFMANAMSDAGGGQSGGGSVILAWIVALGFVGAWLW